MHRVKKLDNRKIDEVGALTRLACGMDGKSDAAKLREVIDSIEQALSSGVRRKKVLETISESLGISMSLKTFEKNLYRIRKNRKSENLKAESNQKQNQHLIIRSDTWRGETKLSETLKNDSEEPKRFITPQERRSFGINALKIADEETYSED